MNEPQTAVGTLLVTGAGGFIGQHIVRHFATLGWRVFGVGRGVGNLPALPGTSWHDLSLPAPQLSALLCQATPDVLIHAASTANVGASMQAPLEDFSRTVDVWAHLLEAVRCNSQHSRVVLLSSAAVYGNPQVLPISEAHPAAPISPYGYHKRICEEIAEYYARLYSVSVCSARIFSAYGPGLRRQVIWDICQKAFGDGPVQLVGTGDESRDFVHVEDVARALERICEHGNFNAGIYNVGSGTATTIRHVATTAVQALGVNTQIVFNGYQRSGDPLYWQADIARLREIGFEPQVDFTRGVRDFAASVQQEQRAAVAQSASGSRMAAAS